MLLSMVVFLFGCKGAFENKIDLNVGPPLTVRQVKVENNQLVVDGGNLNLVTKVEVKGNGLDETFTIETSSAGRIIANGRRNISILLERTFSLILSTAHGASSYQVSFTVQNGAITGAMINSMGAAAGHFLRFNGTSWEPSSVTDPQVYAGVWNANTNIPDLSVPSATPGEYYVVSTAGTFLGITYAVGDWIISDGTAWEKVPYSGSLVTQFQGRRGSVSLLPADYTSMIDTGTQKIPGSSIDDLADVDLTGLAFGKILKFDGTSWIVADDDVVLTNSITTAAIQNNAVTYQKMNIANDEIPQAKVNGLVTALSGKEPSITAGTSSQYIRGDKTLGTFASDVLGTLATGLSTATNSAITAGDSMLSALGKLQAQVSSHAAGFLVKNGTDTISGTVTVSGGSLRVPTPSHVDEATPKQYVDSNFVANAGGAAAVRIGALASRPAAAAGNTGHMYVANDAGNESIYVSSGSTWIKIASNTVTSGTVAIANGGTGSTSFTGDRSVVVNSAGTALVDGPGIATSGTASTLVQRGTAGQVTGAYVKPSTVVVESDDCSAFGAGTIAQDLNGNLLSCQN